MLMPISVFSGIGLAILVPWLFRLFKRRSGLLLALFVAGGVALFAMQIPAIAGGRVIHSDSSWVPSLGISLSFHLDGLSLLFTLLILGIGALVLLYGGSYLDGHPGLPRFFSITLLFMSAMAGLVLSGNALLLFLFWEMTSITSFLLIGFEHQRPAARAAAWQALLVTGAGGLAMLAGFVLIYQVTGSFEIQQWVQSAEQIQQHPLAPVAFGLILLGAMTKSAQFPFHFWLPNAMEAPTPVSAYLHSATMVKAGVYLLARLFPVFSGLELWEPLVSLVGLATLLAGSLLALGQSDLKRLLAYTTVAALGGMLLLLGLGSPLGVETALAFLFAHALYKGALFLVAGGIDHAVHSRDVCELGGLGRAMPFTAAAAGLAALSMAGLPPLFGFITKELVYETLLEASRFPALLTGLVLAGFVAWVAVSGWVGFTPFWAKPRREFHPHEGPPALWLPPLLLAGLGLAAGLLPQVFADALLKPAAEAMLLAPQKIKLSLWHGVTPMLRLSLLTFLLGAGLFATRRWVLSVGGQFWQAVAKAGPASLYQKGLKSILTFAAWLTRVLQSGYLRMYILFIVLFTILLTFFTARTLLDDIPLPRVDAPRFYDVILVAIIVIAAIQVTRTRSRLATITMLGSIGYSIAILFLLYSAPDLAMVQFAMETLTVILFVLIIYRLPKFTRLSGRIPRLVDALVALAGGVLMTVLMLLVSNHPSGSNLANYYANASLPQANGRNIVNVILVDFRGLDTLGEIAVLSIAAVGVFALLKLTGGHPVSKDRPESKMQRSILLAFSARYMMPLIMIFSFFLLIRGHNQIGGGFVGGLVAASALMLYAIATSPAELRKLLPVEPRSLVGIGLLVALLSGLIPLLSGQPFMTGVWVKQAIDVIGKVGTPVLFDVGVYLVVVGIVLWILLTFSEDNP